MTEILNDGNCVGHRQWAQTCD